jgi:hypothetical protein
MDEAHAFPANEEERKRVQAQQEEDLRSWLRSLGVCAGTPWLHEEIRSGTCRLAKCTALKHLEKLGKSSLIDSFTYQGIPLGAHRALDSLHDPIFGPVQAIREMGLKKTATIWAPHMASDVLTPMSLPLPGTFQAGPESTLFDLYARQLVNMKTVVVAPLATVFLTEFLVRINAFGRRTGNNSDPDELRERLQRAHLLTAAWTGAFAAAAFSGGLTPAMVALASSAAWSALASGVYYAARHRAEIEAAAKRAAVTVAKLSRDAKRAAAMRLGPTPVIPAAAAEGPRGRLGATTSTSPAGLVREVHPRKVDDGPGRGRLMVAAALIALVLTTTGP